VGGGGASGLASLGAMTLLPTHHTSEEYEITGAKWSHMCIGAAMAYRYLFKQTFKVFKYF